MMGGFWKEERCRNHSPPHRIDADFNRLCFGRRHWRREYSDLGFLAVHEDCRLPNNVVVDEDGNSIDLETGARVHLKSDWCNHHAHERLRRREEREKNHGITGAATSFFTGARDSVARLWSGKNAHEVDSKNHHCIIRSFFRGAREWIANLSGGKQKLSLVDSESHGGKFGPANSVFTELRRSIESWKHRESFAPSVTSDTEAVEFPTSLDPLVVPPKFNTIVAEVVEKYRAPVLISLRIDSCIGVVEEELRILLKNLKSKLMEQCNSGDGSASPLDHKFCVFLNRHPNVAAHMMFAKNGISPFEEVSMRFDHIASCASSVRHWRHGLSQMQQLVPLVHFGSSLPPVEHKKHEQHHGEFLGEYPHEHKHLEFKEHEHKHKRRFGERLRAVLFPMPKDHFHVHKDWALHDHHELKHDTVAPEEVSCQVCFMRHIHHLAASFHHTVHSMCEAAASPNVAFACNFIHEHKFLVYNTFIETIRPWEIATSECARTCALSPNQMSLFGNHRGFTRSESRSVLRVVQENGPEPMFGEESSMVGKSETDLEERGLGRSLWKIHNREHFHGLLPSVSYVEVHGGHSSNDPHVKKLGCLKTLPLRGPTVHIWKSEGGSGNEVNAWTELVVFYGQPYSSGYLRDPLLHNGKTTRLFKSSDPVLLGNEIMLNPLLQHLKDLDLKEVLKPSKQFESDLPWAAEGKPLHIVSDAMDGQEVEQSETITDNENGYEHSVDTGDDVKQVIVSDAVDGQKVEQRERTTDNENVYEHSVDTGDDVKQVSLDSSSETLDLQSNKEIADNNEGGIAVM